MTVRDIRNVAVLKDIIAWMYKLQTLCNICLVLTTASLVVIQVFMRYVLQSPLMGIEELLIFPVIWMYMLGGASASCERSHIECGIMTLYIKRPLTMAIFNLAKSVVSIGIGSWLMYWAYWYFEYAIRVKKTSALLHVPMVIGQSALFICILLMVFYALADCVDYILQIRAFRAGDKTEEI